MTTLTGSTAQTLKGTVPPPSFGEAMFGAVVQLAVVGFVWLRFTSVGECFGRETFGNTNCISDPWSRSVLITLGISTGCWLFSLRTIPATGTSDPSIVDRLWSVLPWLYCWHFYASAPHQPRLLLCALLATVWGVRLSWNFYIKGGYAGGEDHRWVEIRTWPGFSRGWELFNLLFVCFFQQLILLAFVSPAALAVDSAEPLGVLDAFAAVIYLALVGFEATADYQMLCYQTEKYRRIRAAEPMGEYTRGFVETGLWAFSRHPNYFCEVSLWWVFYLFSIAAGGALVNWTIVGPVFLTCLFVLPRASLDVSETLSSRKYAAYSTYQQRVSRFVPLPPRAPGELPTLSATDKCFIGWFIIGIAITYFIDIEQVVVEDPATYGIGRTPVWPPAPFVRAIHWWGRTADPLVLARPLWFRVAIWIEVVVQAPYYLVALYAFVRQRSWIRLPTIVYSSVLLTIMPIVLSEQYWGPHATSEPLLVTMVYSAYVVMPLLLLWRVRHADVFPLVRTRSVSTWMLFPHASDSAASRASAPAPPAGASPKVSSSHRARRSPARRSPRRTKAD